MSIWIISPGEEASIWNECRDENYIAIGWDNININNFLSKEEIKKELVNLYKEIKSNTKKHNFLWKFGKQIKKGDIVIARNGQSIIVGVGLITSKYIAPNDYINPRKNREYKQIREVNWLNTSEYTLKTGQFARDTIVKTDLNDERVSKYIEGIIMQKEIQEKIDLLTNRKQIILQGPPGTGKTRVAKQIAIRIIDSSLKIETNDDIKNSFTKINKNQIKLIQFHPSYSYEDFVRGIVAKSNGTEIEYKTENKVLAEMAKEAKTDLEENGENANKYILIIDEINRANLSSVLGELIYALEYRGEAVESMYELEGSRKIILPSNLYIIGTMNTADRSIGHIDYAIRRRFAFESVLPDNSVVNDSSKFKIVESLFKNDKNERADTLSLEFNPDDVMLGHSYFIADNDEELKNKLKYQVIPLLIEYIKDGVLNENAREKIEKLKFESDC